MKDSDEDKSETSGKKLVLRGDGSGRLIGIFSKGGKEIYDSDISEWVSKSEISFPPLKKVPISLTDPSPLNTSFLPLVSDLSSSKSFKLLSDYSLYNLEYDFQPDMHVMTPLSHPFDTQKTLQLPNSFDGKLYNFMVSYTVSLVKVVIMSLFSIIGWFSLSLVGFNYHWL